MVVNEPILDYSQLDVDGTALFSHVLTVNANDLDTVTDSGLVSIASGLYALQVYESGVLKDVFLVNK